MNKFIGIIPARYASSRFPGKPLADIGGITMIERVYRQVKKELDQVFVATDDDRIFDTVQSFGGKAIMTSTEHRSGTDRVNEAYHEIDTDANIIINIQGDLLHRNKLLLLKSALTTRTLKLQHLPANTMQQTDLKDFLTLTR